MLSQIGAALPMKPDSLILLSRGEREKKTVSAPCQRHCDELLCLSLCVCFCDFCLSVSLSFFHSFPAFLSRFPDTRCVQRYEASNEVDSHEGIFIPDSRGWGRGVEGWWWWWGALPARVGAKNAAINKSRGGQETDKAMYSIRNDFGKTLTSHPGREVVIFFSLSHRLLHD